jgi:hypothetical protein
MTASEKGNGCGETRVEGNLVFHLYPLIAFESFITNTGSHYVAQAGLELVILLPQPPKCWDY